MDVVTLATVLRRGLVACLLIASLAVVSGSLLGQPILLGFVESGSMAPALETGDGFIAIPSALAGDVSTGDVVVFDAKNIEESGLVTHRVVEETDAGYITKGDANPFRDQGSGEPAVQESQIRAVAFQTDAGVVRVPGVETAVTALQFGLVGIQRLLESGLGDSVPSVSQRVTGAISVGSLVAYVIATLRDRGTTRERSFPNGGARSEGVSVQLILVAASLILVAAATATMVLPAGPTEFGLISADYDSENPTIIPSGESSELTYQVENTGILPVYTYLDSSSDAVTPQTRQTRVSGQTIKNVTLTLTAPPKTGYYEEQLTERRYLAVLPASVIDTLRQYDPWAPVVVIDMLVFMLGYASGSLLLGRNRGRIRFRDANRP